MAGQKLCGKDRYGRCTRSHEYSPGVTVPGGKSGHALQVRQRAEDSGFQTGESLALQEIETGPVDGRKVQRDGSTEVQESEGGQSGCHVKAGKHVWIRIKVNRRPGCGIFEHQGSRVEENP